MHRGMPGNLITSFRVPWVRFTIAPSEIVRGALPGSLDDILSAYQHDHGENIMIFDETFVRMRSLFGNSAKFAQLDECYR